MAKYNITEKKKKEAAYTTALSTTLVEEIYEKILLKFVVEKKYRDPAYTAAKMAEEIGYNARYISAVVHLRYRDNFSQLINDFRIKEAMFAFESNFVDRVTQACYDDMKYSLERITSRLSGKG